MQGLGFLCSSNAVICLSVMQKVLLNDQPNCSEKSFCSEQVALNTSSKLVCMSLVVLQPLTANHVSRGIRLLFIR